MDFIEGRAGCRFTCSVCQTGAADGAVVCSLARRTTVAFLRRHLRGEAEMDRWLSGAGIQADATAGLLAFSSKQIARAPLAPRPTGVLEYRHSAIYPYGYE